VLCLGRRPLVLTSARGQRGSQRVLSVPTVFFYEFDKHRYSIGIASYGIEGVE